MNEITKVETHPTAWQLSKEQSLLLPIAESYIQLCPEVANDKAFNAKQALISMALKLKEVKDKDNRPAIDVCTKESIMQVAQEVLVKRLDIMKSQASLIVRGNKLVLQIQYQGQVKRALELNPFLSHFNFVPIYQQDKVEIEIGKDGSYGIKSHTTSFSNIGNNNLVGGYVKAIKKDGSVYMTEIMTMEQVKIAWSKSPNSSLSVHKSFPAKMLRKTILNSLCSWLINTTGDQEIIADGEYGNNDESDTSLDVTIDESQDYSELTEIQEEPETEEWTEAEIEEALESEETEQDEDELTVPYSKWINEYKNNGWAQVQGSYDRESKTVKIRKA